MTGIFLPVSNSLKHNFEYGYVTRGNKMALHKLHLASVMYAKEISLGEFGCLPRSIHFIPIGEFSGSGEFTANNLGRKVIN